MTSELITRFNEEMFNLYRKTVNETTYRPTRFHEMLEKDGGVETARRLLNTDTCPMDILDFGGLEGLIFLSRQSFGKTRSIKLCLPKKNSKLSKKG